MGKKNWADVGDKPGHLYELFDVAMAPPNAQELQFLEKAPDDNGNFELVTDGTTNEAVLEVVIDRLTVLNRMLPSRQNSIAIRKLEEAVMWLNDRTAERVARGVEGSVFG